jgi:hypothetical protein
MPRPAIRHRELHFDRRIPSHELPERCAKAGEGAASGSEVAALRAFRFSARWRLLRGVPMHLVLWHTNVSVARLTK